MARSQRTIGTSEAAAIIGISAGLLRYRALSGRIRVWRWRPLRFRIADVFNSLEQMRRRDRRGRKPYKNDKLDRLMSEVLQ